MGRVWEWPKLKYSATWILIRNQFLEQADLWGNHKHCELWLAVMEEHIISLPFSSSSKADDKSN